MNNRTLFKNIMGHKSDRVGFWHGNPNPDYREQIFAHYKVANDFELGLKLGSTCRWVMPEEHGAWTNKRTPMMDALGGQKQTSLSQDGVFAHAETVEEIEAFPWPELKHLDFTQTIKEIDKTIVAGQAVLSGMWSPFFHNVSDFFGMENYFVKMHTHPEVVDAVTRRIVDFYLAANEMLFDAAGDKIDAFFFGNDFGSQLDLLISPAAFDRFVMPYFEQFTKQAHGRGYHVVLHSCGSIARVIPQLIAAGVETIHPIQARAANMDAETLAKKYNGQVVFMGGVDAQGVLPFGTPDEVAAEVRKLKELFGKNFIVSPSHESLLPNIPFANIDSMAKAALE